MDILSFIYSPSTINELIAGSFGGAAQVIIGQPLDTIKTRAQIAPSMLDVLNILLNLLWIDGSGLIARGHVCESAMHTLSS